MARKLRNQNPGALHHIINRGNYRREVFATVGAAQAFEHAIDETCRRFHWRMHAYVIMRNHFHFGLETPQPNLADGMHWLQRTFAIRFNRFRKDRGHLFRGRYEGHALQAETWNSVSVTASRLTVSLWRKRREAPLTSHGK